MSENAPQDAKDENEPWDDDAWEDDSWGDEEQDQERIKEERARYLKIFGAIAMALVIVGGIILYASSRKSSPPQDNTVTISPQERKSMEETVKFLGNTAGTWGVSADLTGKNIMSVNTSIQAQDDSASSYYVERQDAYGELASAGSIVPNSPLDYGSTASTWTDDTARTSLASFRVKSIVATAPQKGTKTLYSGSMVPQATVHLSMTVQERTRVMTADDSAWDGTWNIMQKIVPVEADVIMLKQGGSWKLYDLRNQKNGWALATWPNSQDYSSSQFNLARIGTLKSDIKKAP